MSHIVPHVVEQYLGGLNTLSDPVLQQVYGEGIDRGLPLVDPEVGALLHVLASAIGATRILEIGTALGYSGIWLARALPPGGALVTIEIDEALAQEARQNFVKAAVADSVTLMVGDAHDLLATMAGPFDLVFQDGDKQDYLPMLGAIAALLRPGGVLVSDNVLWSGRVIPGFAPMSVRPDADTQAIADYNDRLSRHPDLMTATVPLRDGVAISVKRRPAGSPADLRSRRASPATA